MTDQENDRNIFNIATLNSSLDSTINSESDILSSVVDHTPVPELEEDHALRVSYFFLKLKINDFN